MASIFRGRSPSDSDLFERPQAPRGHVLVIDNDPTISSVVRRILDRSYEVADCTNAEDGLSLVSRGEVYDVILCDVLMPHVSGSDYYTRLLALSPTLAGRVIFITGAASLAETQRFIQSIPNPVLEKPFTSAALKDLVESMSRGGVHGRSVRRVAIP